jgi:hypothetical protein
VPVRSGDDVWKLKGRKRSKLAKWSYQSTVEARIDLKEVDRGERTARRPVLVACKRREGIVIGCSEPQEGEAHVPLTPKSYLT